MPHSQTLNHLSAVLKVGEVSLWVKLVEDVTVHGCHLYESKEELPPPLTTLPDEGLVNAVLISPIHPIH